MKTNEPRSLPPRRRTISLGSAHTGSTPRPMPGRTLIAAALVVAVGVAVTHASWAQDEPAAPQNLAADAAGQNGQSVANVDPPGRIARLNYTAGTVTTEPAGATDWSYAQINRPLTTGDQLWNERGARSELHIGSTAVRLGESTSLDVLNLDDNTAQLKVAQGTLSTRVREIPPGSSYEIDTPNLALGIDGPGDYRVDVAPDGSSTTVTVRSGQATAYGDGGQMPIAAGRQIRFGGTGLQQIGDNQVPGLDNLDQWALSRDAAEDRSVSAQYVSRDMPGYQDLDANGSWQSNPQYGEVWVPRATPAGWAPYRDGHWVWQAPWGWTWIDDQPWGFAPYHYGRWAQIDGTWAWVPGPLVADAPPVYAPALVAFVGGDEGAPGIPDWGVNLAIGGVVAAGVAWFPLGPGERWHPHWGHHDHWSPGYYERVNRTTIVNNYNRHVDIHNTYVNYHARGGLTAVPATAFVHGQPVGRFAQNVDPRQWRNARINPGGPGIAPVRESFAAGVRHANDRPPASIATRAVMATRDPATPAAWRDSLAQRFAQSGGRVPGGGQPIVRTTVPARMAGMPGALPTQNVRIVKSHIAGRTPGAAAGAPMPAMTAGVAPGVPAAANGGARRAGPAGQWVQAGGPGRRGQPGEAGAAGQAAQPIAGAPAAGRQAPPAGPSPMHPGIAPQTVADQRPQQPGATAHPTNGVPRPPQADGGPQSAHMAGLAPVHGNSPQPTREWGATGHAPAPVWMQPHTSIAQLNGARQVPPTGPGYGSPYTRQPDGTMTQQGVPRPVNPPAQMLTPRSAEPQMGRPGQFERPRREPPRWQPNPQANPQVRPEPQAQQVPQPMPQHMPPPMRVEPRPQPVQQPQFAPRPQPMPQPQPRPEPRPQQVQQQIPQPHFEPRPQQVQQPRPQPQRGEQHSGGGGNRDEHRRG